MRRQNVLDFFSGRGWEYDRRDATKRRANMARQEKKPSGKARSITRIVLILILVLAIVFGLKWRGAMGEFVKRVWQDTWSP